MKTKKKTVRITNRDFLLRYSSAILPIGQVKVKTGANAMHGTVWDCWPGDEVCSSCGRGGETGLGLVRFDDGVLRLVHDFLPHMKEGQRNRYSDDQSISDLGVGETVAVRPNTKEGLLELGKIANRRSLSAWVVK